MGPVQKTHPCVMGDFAIFHTSHSPREVEHMLWHGANLIGASFVLEVEVGVPFRSFGPVVSTKMVSSKRDTGREVKVKRYLKVETKLEIDVLCSVLEVP